MLCSIRMRMGARVRRYASAAPAACYMGLCWQRAKRVPPPTNGWVHLPASHAQHQRMLSTQCRANCNSPRRPVTGAGRGLFTVKSVFSLHAGGMEQQ